MIKGPIHKGDTVNINICTLNKKQIHEAKIDRTEGSDS